MKNVWIRIAWIGGVILSLAGMSKQVADACQIIIKENKPQVLLAQNSSFCQQLKKGYQEVHSFETQNFYINVCRHQQQYYYHRKSKQNPDYSIVLPASSILNGNMFQAIDRGKTYIVGTNADGYYSSVMHKNNEIIFEPALRQSTLIDNRFEMESSNGNQNKWTKCSNNYSDSHLSYGWQQLRAVFN
ncbi:MAG: hypothetical protein QNJ41_28685 [Xenococcaceae cyanobacterium MO_188.B32]|nr:hypothetical protein [Xenococcaceae cyanobacterium MO_188.B32]